MSNQIYTKHYNIAFFVGILAGIFGAIIKWGWEVPFPPRNPNIPWPSDMMERITPPKIFLDQLGIPSDWTYHFSGIDLPLSIFIVHIGFSVFFAVLYSVLAEKFTFIKMGQGMVCGFFIFLFAHIIVMPLIGHLPPLSQIPFDENLSELFGHLIWFWGIEIARKELRNRFTHEIEK